MSKKLVTFLFSTCLIIVLLSSVLLAGCAKKVTPTAPAATTPASTSRRKVQRRRQIDPTTCERDYSDDEIEFMQAMDAYKRAAGRMFPTCSEVLEVVRSLGYVRLTSAQRDLLAAETAQEPTSA